MKISSKEILKIVNTFGITEAVKFMITGSNIPSGAKSLDYPTYKIDEIAIVIKLPTEIAICSTVGFETVSAYSLFDLQDKIVYSAMHDLDTSQAQDTLQAQDTSFMFANCSSLKELDISNFVINKGSDT